MKPHAAFWIGLAALGTVPVLAVDSPWISDTYFYWYSWQGEEKLGSWMGGVYNTPLYGYYDSASLQANTDQLHTAAEWGLTTHFMDYWGPGWQGDDGGPRESTLMRATEAVRAAGYPIFMGVYQDGEDFDMAEFSANLNPGRDAHFYFDLLGRNEAYPRVGGKPVALIYGRNGTPKQSATDEGFRAAMREKYGTVDALNLRWGTSLRSFDEVALDFGGGFARYESIRYQYAVWQAEQQKADAAAGRQWGVPGVLTSFDIAYQPYRGWGFSGMPRVFIGPHSYGGIFGRPETESAERFIQAQVAKAYGSLFFDTFKNFYHDWEIRNPGICYPELFDAFDRFWVNVLLNKSEALLHLSWNEWWEGSNLEPCLEYGKTYCEKNLLWASVMQQCFPSIRNWNGGAKVAVLLNDWLWYTGVNNQADVYGVIQALRRSGAVFDLLPDDLVTTAKLAQFDAVIAPSAAAGLGFNAEGQAILPLLRAWVEAEPDRKLVLSRVPGAVDPASRMLVAEWLGLRKVPAQGQASRPGDDMNLFVDVGAEGDDRFLVSGMTFREDWARIPAESYGARDRAYTVRWTPGVGRETMFVVPLSPRREHVVRFGGSAIWPNTLHILLNGTEVATIATGTGDTEHEATIPAAAVGDATTGELVFRWERANVPTVLDPEHYPTENRVCNLALDYLQVATAGTPLSRQNNYRTVRHTLRATAAAPLQGTFGVPYAKRDRLAGGTAWTVAGDGSPRDSLVRAGAGQVLYADGLIGTVEEPGYLDGILAWAGARGEVRATGDDVAWTTLDAGDTKLVLLHNDAAMEPREVTVTVPPGDLPLAEVRAISRNGREFAGLFEPTAVIKDTLTTYGAYTFVHSMVRLETPFLDVLPGETRAIEVELTNLTDRAVQGTLGNGWHLPSLRIEPLEFELGPREAKTVPVTFVARDDCDWGRKTVVLSLEADGRTAFLWRPVRVWRPADCVVDEAVLTAGSGSAYVSWRTPGPGVRPVGAGHERIAAETVTYTPDHLYIDGPGLVSGTGQRGLPRGSSNTSLTVSNRTPLPEGLSTREAVLHWECRGRKYSRPFHFNAYVAPAEADRVRGAKLVQYVANSGDGPITARAVGCGQGLGACDAAGRALPSAVDERGNLRVLVDLPPRSVTPIYVLDRPLPGPTDLVVEQHHLGTGRGTVSVRNSYLRVTWSEAAGGTITELRTLHDGVDHAAPNCGGVALGRWGRFDPTEPTINAVAFVEQARKQHQCDGPAADLSVSGNGIEARVNVRWRGNELAAQQSFWLRAYAPRLTLNASAQTSKPLANGTELVVADFHFRRGQWNKIYPNFTGIDEELREGGPHGGWREAPHVPEVTTLMQNPGFGGSLSVVGRQAPQGCNWFRQGFWPARPPETGPVDFARLEYARTSGTSASFRGTILFHDGHQLEARRQLDRDRAGLVLSGTAVPRRTAEAPPEEPPADWWNPGWHHRATVRVGPFPRDLTDPVFPLPLKLAPRLANLDPDSPRAIIAGHLVPLAYRPGTDELTLRLPGLRPQGAEATVTLYYDSLDHGPKPPAPWAARMPGGSLLDASFEQGGRGWQLAAPGEFSRGGAHTGEGCAILHRTDGMGPVVLQTASQVIVPEATYHVSFWAKTSDARQFVYTNLYHPEHDAPAAHLAIAADGQWHRYDADLPSGMFPPDIVMVLRFWLLDAAGRVAIDDVELVRGGGSAALEVPVRAVD